MVLFATGAARLEWPLSLQHLSLWGYVSSVLSHALFQETPFLDGPPSCALCVLDTIEGLHCLLRFRGYWTLSGGLHCLLWVLDTIGGLHCLLCPCGY